MFPRTFEQQNTNNQALQLLRLHFIFQVGESTFRLPAFAGSLWRGVFGGALKHLSCVGSYEQCKESCGDTDVCLYGRIFSPKRKEHAEHGFYDPPRLFALKLSSIGSTDYKPHSRYDLGMILIGEATRWVDAIIGALKRAASRGLGYEKTKLILLRSVILPVDIRTQNANTGEITLRFITPTRLVEQGHFVDNPTFHQIMRAVLRRVISIHEACGIELALPIREILQKSVEITTLRSNLKWFDACTKRRTGDNMPLGGIIGDITYSGDFDEFLALLSLGSVLNIGKHATFGMGNYEILP